jgi:outer membrane protein insertion porin family/translocation and assembly module TamA
MVAAALGRAPRAAAQGVRPATRRDRPEVLSLDFVGARAIPKGALASSIVTQASHCKSLFLAPFCLISKSHIFYQREYLNRDELKRDVLRLLILYYKRGYRDAVVDTALTPPHATTARVTFTISEGLPTRLSGIAIVPDTIFDARARKRLLHLHVGQPLDLYALDSAITAMRQSLWNRGYADATVDTATTVGGGAMPTAALAFRVTPGRKATVGTVTVAGNSKVSSTTVRHSLSFRPGEPFLRDQVASDQRALYESGMFRRAAIAVTPDSARGDSVKDLNVTVVEAPLHRAQLRTGFSTVQFFQASGQLTTYNFLGGGRQLTLSAGADNLLAPQLNDRFIFQNVIHLAGDQGFSTSQFLDPDWNLGADLVQPWFLGQRNSLGAGVFARRRSAPGVFVETGYGANATFTRQLFSGVTASLRYQFEETNTSSTQVYYCVNFGACDGPSVQALNGRHTLSPLIFTANVDRSDDPSYPTRGYTGHVDLEHASSVTLSDFHYNRAYGEAAWFTAIGHFNQSAIGTGVLALHAAAGWVSPIGRYNPADSTNVANILYPRVRFYAGGANSVRGFGENQLGPRVLTVSPDSLRQRNIAITPHHDTTVVFCGPSVALVNCNPNAQTQYRDVNGKLRTVTISDQQFTPRPLGGNTLLAGTLEYRFPIVGSLGAAVFADGAIVGGGSGLGGQSLPAVGSVTPGVGIRYYSSVGAIRVDIGFNPVTTYSLTVITQQGSGSTASLVTLSGKRTYAPALTEGGLTGLLNRVVLNLSIGQAF